ncbi:protein-L-isoaspartate O-methyltransferase, partial [Citrobacter sp. AAK_AS5]
RHRKLAFADLSIPLEHGEFMMKPVVEGRLLQALALNGDEDVLEIGTGSGFMAACLSRLARQVVSLEIHGDLAERARGRIG